MMQREYMRMLYKKYGNNKKKDNKRVCYCRASRESSAVQQFK